MEDLILKAVTKKGQVERLDMVMEVMRMGLEAEERSQEVAHNGMSEIRVCETNELGGE